MNSTRALQLILPTDKRNPCFTLYQDDTEQRIHVYYGLELLPVVPADRQQVQYKLLVANLYNAGLKVTSLEDLFGTCITNIEAATTPNSAGKCWWCLGSNYRRRPFAPC
jgi:hypothetical protein